MVLAEYKRKRHFSQTPEPKGVVRRSKDAHRFVIQKHAARRLHYDFRLELDGVLKSWAVPKGPSLDPKVRALAVHVEDHPIEYGSFEGTIPKDQYGAGTVMLWDRGTWDPEGNPRDGFRKGKLKFALHGEKLHGRWTLIRMGGAAGEGGKNWLLKKLEDVESQPETKANILDDSPDSVATGRTMDEIAADQDRVWTSDQTKSRSKKKKLDSSRKKAARRSTKNRVSPTSLPGAVRRAQPTAFQPQLATPAREVPAGNDWLHELKFDGYRLICILQNSRPRLLTRRGNDWTSRFPTIVEAARALPVKNAILDGEVVVLAPNGTTDFQALQNMMQRQRDDQIVYYVFDLPHCNGYELTQTPLGDRKALLKSLLYGFSSSGAIRYSDHIVGNGVAAFSDACRRGLEGLISKRIDSLYRQRRSDDWLKVKCLSRQEFVIGGWTDPGGSRSGFGSLLLGYYDNQGGFQFAGKVGTGFTSQSLKQIKSALHALEQEQPPFDRPPRGAGTRGVHWTKPKMVAEIEFTEWTADGRLRSPSFQGLREDKKPEEVFREIPVDPPSDEMTDADRIEPNDNQPAGVRLSNPNRVLYPEQGLTKRDLASYYVQVADWILPHLVHRPLTLVRCPQGHRKQCFYQKHLAETLPESVRGINVAEQKGTELYVAVDDLPGLIGLVQMSVLEIHPWGSQEDKLEYPDRMVFDLDPGPEVAWKDVVGAAKEVREILAALKLTSFVRTTGGKGLHVVTPLMRRAEWQVVKDFAHAIADFLARYAPAKYVATASKAKRKGKIYADYLRNDRGATAIASYSTRARTGAPVATPVDWDELTPQLDPSGFTIETVPKRLSELKKDPWEGFFQIRQSITAAMLKQIKR